MTIWFTHLLQSPQTIFNLHSPPPQPHNSGAIFCALLPLLLLFHKSHPCSQLTRRPKFMCFTHWQGVQIWLVIQYRTSLWWSQWNSNPINQEPPSKNSTWYTTYSSFFQQLHGLICTLADRCRSSWIRLNLLDLHGPFWTFMDPIRPSWAL